MAVINIVRLNKNRHEKKNCSRKLEDELHIG